MSAPFAAITSTSNSNLRRFRLPYAESRVPTCPFCGRSLRTPQSSRGGDRPEPARGLARLHKHRLTRRSFGRSTRSRAPYFGTFLESSRIKRRGGLPSTSRCCTRDQRLLTPHHDGRPHPHWRHVWQFAEVVPHVRHGAERAGPPPTLPLVLPGAPRVYYCYGDGAEEFGERVAVPALNASLVSLKR